MTENENYELVPVEWSDNEQAWDVRILTGDFLETVVRFGNVAIAKDRLTFNFKVVYSPDSELSETDTNLQDTVGEILENIIENSLKRNEASITEKA